MASQGTEKQNGTRHEGLTLETAKQIFSNGTMAADSSFDIVKQYYHPNVRFRDAIQELHGRDEFIEMTQRFLKRCKDLDVKLNDAAQTGNVIFLQWTMRMRFGRSPVTTMEGATKLTLDAQGKVIEHRDYFDMWGDTLDAIPGVGPLYRKLMKKLG